MIAALWIGLACLVALAVCRRIAGGESVKGLDGPIKVRRGRH